MKKQPPNSARSDFSREAGNPIYFINVKSLSKKKRAIVSEQALANQLTAGTSHTLLRILTNRLRSGEKD